jgi:glutamate--cysteine ligase
VQPQIERYNPTPLLMSLDSKTQDDRPVTSVADLVQTFVGAERREGPLLLGLEHEKLIVAAGTDQPAPYAGPAGIGALLEGFKAKGFSSFSEAPGLPTIAMIRGSETLTLEPGGQFELSGSPFVTAREAHAQNVAHAADLAHIARQLGLIAVTLGYRPVGTVADMPWMPKSRYGAMRRTLGARGALALDMMLMTATGQASFDWRDEADCARKVELTCRISPLLVALYANSPLRAGQASGFQSFRSHVWTQVDPARCGYPQAMLDGGFSYARYVAWALEAPLLFLRRHGQYLTPNMTFGQLLQDGFEGRPATQADWADHLSTLFPEVRLKRVLEVRAADCNDVPMTGALGALMRGILYDKTALDEASLVVPRLTPDAHRELHAATQREGMRTKLHGVSVADAARDLVAIAKRGLGRIDALDVPVLEPLERVAAAGVSPAESVLADLQRGMPGLMGRRAVH